MSSQIWQIPVSPAQRWVLVNLSMGPDQKVKTGQQGRVFRRFMRALALDRIRDSLNTHQGVYNLAQAASEKPALFELTMENIEETLKLAEIERTAAAEMALGELFDLLADLKSGKEYAAPEGVAKFDPEADDWSPKSKTEDAADRVVEKIAAWLEKKGDRDPGALTLALDVRRGVWDAPETPVSVEQRQAVAQS